jgi:hypothetical protein
MLVVHYIAHWTNLIMQTYCKWPLVQTLKRNLHSAYTFFFFSPKKHLEQCKLCSIIGNKGRPVVMQCNFRLVSCQEASWRVQTFSCEKNWAYPCHPSCKNNCWILVWCWDCHGCHLHYAHVESCPWIHQVCSKPWYFCLWLYESCEGVFCRFVHILLQTIKKSTLICSSRVLLILWITQMVGCSKLSGFIQPQIFNMPF